MQNQNTLGLPYKAPAPDAVRVIYYRRGIEGLSRKLWSSKNSYPEFAELIEELRDICNLNCALCTGDWLVRIAVRSRAATITFAEDTDETGELWGRLHKYRSSRSLHLPDCTLDIILSDHILYTTQEFAQLKTNQQ